MSGLLHHLIKSNYLAQVNNAMLPSSENMTKAETIYQYLLFVFILRVRLLKRRDRHTGGFGQCNDLQCVTVFSRLSDAKNLLQPQLLLL